MGCKIVFSPQAIADLEKAVRYIARSNPEAALRLGNALIDKVAILGSFPEIGQPYRRRPGVRKLISNPYVIYYRINDRQQSVEIMRYWHGARREPPL